MRGRRVTSVTGLIGVLLAASLSACSSGPEPVVMPPLDATTDAGPTFDLTLQPAAAVMALVPADATSLAVNDFDQIKLDVGLPSVTSASSAAEQAELARRGATKSPEFTPGILSKDDSRLRAAYGFGQADVQWEAYWTTPSGAGWAIKLSDDVANTGPEAAGKAQVGALKGSTYYPTTHVFLENGTIDPTQSWRADPTLTALVGQVAAATYVHRGCLSVATAIGSDLTSPLADTTAADLRKLDALDAFSVSFGSDLVTARLGALRSDIFDRARLPDTLPRTSPEFGRGFGQPVVADPSGGRIGYRLDTPVVAARLTLQQRLPFAVCPGN